MPCLTIHNPLLVMSVTSSLPAPASFVSSDEQLLQVLLFQLDPRTAVYSRLAADKFNCVRNDNYSLPVVVWLSVHATSGRRELR